MPLQNMPLWHKNYFELKATEKQQTQEELSVLLLSDQKQGMCFLSINEISICKGSPSPIPRGEQLLTLEMTPR